MFGVRASVTPQPRDLWIRGGVEGHGGKGYKQGGGGAEYQTPYLSWYCKSGPAVNKWTNIQPVLHGVVTAAWLFICVPSSEKEAAAIGSRC